MATEVDDDPLANRNRAADLERIKQARKKRISQLKSWQQYDKIMDKNKAAPTKPLRAKFVKRNVHFLQCLILLEASGRGDIDEVKTILESGANPDVCNDDGLTALHQCCIDNNLEICQLLLQFGVNINATDSEMWTPLHAAAACAHIDICACLIESGAELLALNAEGNMPYDICEEENTLDLIENAMAIRGISQEDIDERRKLPEINMLNDLKKTNFDLTQLDKQGATFLHIASACGYIEVGKFLLESDVPVDILDKDGWQALHVAACWGQLEFIDLLLVHGADIHSTTRSGDTIHDICEDPDMNQKLLQMKEEMDRLHEIKKTQDVKPSRSQLNRRSTLTKRSASIRRSSMREKSLMSWKEARQEALIREAVQKHIATDSTMDSGVGIDQNGNNNDKVNGMTDKEIDISQVLVNVQLVTENEMALREPLVRRGSSRNSFTHSHPYHSPSRDPTLMEQSIDEDSSSEDKNVDETDIKKFVPILGGNRNNQRNGKNQPLNVEIKTKEIAPAGKNEPIDNSNFQRNCDPNASVKGARSDVNNVQRRENQRKEIENKPINKNNKVQGCCVVM